MCSFLILNPCSLSFWWIEKHALKLSSGNETIVYRSSQQGGQRVFLPNCIPSRSRYRHSNKLWAQWHLYLWEGINLHTIWHQRIELLEVLVEMLLALAIRLQICGELNAPTELLTGVLQPWKDKLGGIIGLARNKCNKRKTSNFVIYLPVEIPEGFICSSIHSQY